MGVISTVSPTLLIIPLLPLMEDSTTVKETTTISGGLPPTGLLDLSSAAVPSTQNAADRSLDVADSEAAASSLLFSIPMK